MPGKLIIISAPSGAGKTTIVNRVLKDIPELSFSVSAASRPMREGEVHGSDYYFLPEKDFRKAIEKGDFLEWEEVYPGQFYGTLRSEVERLWQTGKSVIFDLDVLGGLNLKKQFGRDAMAIFIMPPSVKELENRLRNRSTETEEKIRVRLARAKEELARSNEFDALVVNDNLELAISETEKLIRSFLKKGKI